MCSQKTDETTDSDRVDEEAEQRLRSVARRAQDLVQQVQSSNLEPARAWDEAFRTRKYASAVLAEAVFILHREQKYDLAVEGLLSSLRNDHSQPWTYDVLATEMALANRPQSEIERVLVSRVDFTTTSVPQMMLTAAMLSRMDAGAPAIKLCQQAAEMQPHLPDLWLLGRRIADGADDAEAQVWARCGVLRYVHSPVHAADRREAREALERMIAAAEARGDSRLASEIREKLIDASTLDLKIRLKWVGKADLDLLVEEPDGERCDLRQRVTPSGGQLVRDDGGFGDRRNGQRIEEYVCPSAKPGTYIAVVRFVFGNVVAGNAVLEVIQHEGTARETRSSTTVSLSRKDARIKVVLKDGRAGTDR